MNIKRTLAALGVLAIASLGLAASASADSGSRNQHFTALSTSTAQDAPLILIATGPIHARGTDQPVKGSSTRDTFIFPKGTLRIHHTAGHDNGTFDPVTCYGTFTETGTYQVTGGTGAYKGAQGHGTYSVKGTFVGCNQNAAPDFFSLEINAFGPLSL
jgi:hypothetical protein